MTDADELVEVIEDLHQRLDRWFQRAAELEEMLTAATDVAVQRGKAIDELAASVVYWRDSYYRVREDRDGG